jgi:hypothetical protein
MPSHLSPALTSVGPNIQRLSSPPFGELSQTTPLKTALGRTTNPPWLDRREAGHHSALPRNFT